LKSVLNRSEAIAAWMWFKGLLKDLQLCKIEHPEKNPRKCHPCLQTSLSEIVHQMKLQKYVPPKSRAAFHAGTETRLVSDTFVPMYRATTTGIRHMNSDLAIYYWMAGHSIEDCLPYRPRASADNSKFPGYDGEQNGSGKTSDSTYSALSGNKGVAVIARIFQKCQHDSVKWQNLKERERVSFKHTE